MKRFGKMFNKWTYESSTTMSRSWEYGAFFLLHHSQAKVAAVFLDFFFISFFFLPETLVQDVCLIASITSGSAHVAGALVDAPVGGWHTRVHLAEEQPEDSFSVLPVQVYQLDWLLYLFACWRGLLKWSAFRAEPLVTVYQRKELGLRHYEAALLLDFPSLFLLNLFECFEEELLDVWTLVHNHLAIRLQSFHFVTLQSYRLLQVADLIALFSD